MRDEPNKRCVFGAARVSTVISLENAPGAKIVQPSINHPGAFSEVEGRSSYKEKGHPGVNTPQGCGPLFHTFDMYVHTHTVFALEPTMSGLDNAYEQAFGPTKDKEDFTKKKQKTGETGERGCLQRSRPGIKTT